RRAAPEDCPAGYQDLGNRLLSRGRCRTRRRDPASRDRADRGGGVRRGLQHRRWLAVPKSRMIAPGGRTGDICGLGRFGVLRASRQTMDVSCSERPHGRRPSRTDRFPSRSSLGVAMKKTGLLGLAILMTVGASAASAQGRVAGVAKAMPTRYIEPTCDLRAGHFMVQSGVTYLAVGSGGNRNVDGTTDPEKVETALNNAVRVITQAIRENNQGNNPAAWYYLGRAYLQMGDVVGADTAFTRAVSLAPACSEDVKSWRQRAVLPLMAPAAEYADQGKIDSAIVLLKQASSMAPGMPQADYNIGVLYANADQPDSAIK